MREKKYLKFFDLKLDIGMLKDMRKEEKKDKSLVTTEYGYVIVNRRTESELLF